MLFRNLMYGWLCCCAGVLALPEVALACLYGTEFRIEEVMANGLVHLRWNCRDRYCNAQDVPNPLRVVDASTQAEVPGTVVWTRGEDTMVIDVFWRATEPLVASRTYRVLDIKAVSPIRDEFTVLPAVTWAATGELELKAALDPIEDRSAGAISCPARYQVNRCPPSTAPSSKDATVYTRWETAVWISAYARHASRPVPPMKERAVYWREGEMPIDLASKPWSLAAGEMRITEGAARYCYRSAVQNLLDGSERIWEGCLDHGDLPPLTTREASRAEITRDTESCAEPPAGYETEWCEASMAACQRQYRPPMLDCEDVAKRCTPPAEDDDAGAPEHDRDAGEPRKPRTRTASDSGCSAPGGPHGDFSPLLLLAAACTVAVLRRRKRT